MSNIVKAEFILGLDLGPNSLGWSLVRYENKCPVEISAAGVRVFAAGLDNLDSGKGESRNVERRMARQVRRGNERTARRIRKLALALQRSGLLPEGDMRSSQARNQIFNDLDSQLADCFVLRAKALDDKLEPHELGRILYHLAQKRGFLSNRKSKAKKNDDSGIVKKNISELGKKIADSGSRTLGEYLSTLDPRESRIRGNYTGRQMRIDEFELIWNRQRQYHEVLTDELKKKVYHCIFHQRDLKSQSHLIGKCELEKSRKRAPWVLLMAQRFRYLQKINDLRLIDKVTGEIRCLDLPERALLIDKLEQSENVSFAGIRKLSPTLKHVDFNLEEGEESKIPGNKSAARLRKIFGADRWDDMTQKVRDAVVEDWINSRTDKNLYKRGRKARDKNGWGMTEEQAIMFSELNLESGYCSFSRQAMAKILPRLEQGVQLQTAIQEEYPDRAIEGEPLDLLPSLESDLVPDLRNPIVSRTLTELRHLVNALLRRYGKPEKIRIELARDLRQTSRQRLETVKRNRLGEKLREEAVKNILAETGIDNPSRTDIQRVLLAEECNWICPYTGRSIGMPALIGDHPDFDIEHIIPFERSLDDSFANKTLCYAPENRGVKKNRAPYEAYHTSPTWDEILSRVGKFQGRMDREKLRRFRLTSEEVTREIADFTARQLNDTRWASKWAKRYIGLLYGGADANGVDAFGKLRVQATSGSVTAFLRQAWGLNGILSDGDFKSRDDHRHHAVDATVIALTEPRTVKLLNDAAERSSNLRQPRKFDDVETPYAGFRNDVESRIRTLIPSHRVSHRVRGALHTGTYYGSERVDEKGKKYVTVRKPLEGLSDKDVCKIIDPVVRVIVSENLAKSGEPPKKAFADISAHPTIPNRIGKPVPIHRVRVRDNLSTFDIAEDHRLRHVVSDTNHHMEVVAILDKDGKTTKWEGHVISMYEAYERKRRGEAVIQKLFGPDKQFLFSLAGGDIIELDCAPDQRQLFVLRTVPKSLQVRFVGICDARILSEIPKSGMTAFPETLRLRKCRKIVITPLGEARYAND